MTTLLCLSGSTIAYAQAIPTSSKPKLAPDSPFQDPDVIYLEADEVINNETEQTLIAVGEVEGRYQDRTLRADRVTYYLAQKRVVASGNVVLINNDGSTQYAESFELSDELETGTAYSFTSRLPNGGVTGAAVAQRREDGIDLYNAYYTACEVCEDNKNPSWQIKAKRVSQDSEKNTILYKDAVFELFGVPVFYTPYLAHPDPSQDRASGWLAPYGGYSSARGAFIEAPYYMQLDDYSELTLTPHIFTKVNPLLELDYRRKFYSGEVNINSSLTYASAFDRNGDPFTSDSTYTFAPEHAPVGRRLRSHFFADGEFGLGDNWDWGFTAQFASDDLYTRRYDLGNPQRAGLYDGDSRRLISQLYALGQSENFRFTASTYGFQSLRTTIRENDSPDSFRIIREDDSRLPIIAPKIEASYYVNDPLVNGRLELFGDFAMLTRDIGTDYRRGTAGMAYNKTFIAPGGFEIKPFGDVRYDNFSLTPYDFDNDADFDDIDFERTTGQVGLDVRLPFIKSSGNVDIIVEPRAMVTQNFGDGNVQALRPDLDNDGISNQILLQDSIDIDFDHNLIWSANKSTGYDIWQKGFRADVGGAVTAMWDDNYTSLFLGQSFTDDVTDVFDLESGLAATEQVLDTVTGQTVEQVVDKSDMVGQFELVFSDKFIFDTRLRYDDDERKFRRLDTGFSFNSKLISGRARYYKIDRATLLSEDGAPAEEITGRVGLKVTDNWRLSYSATHDLDQSITRRQTFGIGYSDHCTDIALEYTTRNFQGDAVNQSDTIGVRVSLRSLGQFGTDNRRENF